MYREIKYKAWLPCKQVLADVIMIDLKNKEVHYTYKDKERHARFGYDEYEEMVTLIQYTGLKDKNGVEIYEDSDVLKITNTKRFTGGKDYTCYSKVKIIDGHAYDWPHPIVDGKPIRFGAKMLLSGMAKRIEMRGVATNDVEVVGNIYDKPELMVRDLN